MCIWCVSRILRFSAILLNGTASAFPKHHAWPYPGNLYIVFKIIFGCCQAKKNNCAWEMNFYGLHEYDERDFG